MSIIQCREVYLGVSQSNLERCLDLAPFLKVSISMAGRPKGFYVLGQGFYHYAGKVVPWPKPPEPL